MSVGIVWQRIALILLCISLTATLVASQDVVGEAGAEGEDANTGLRPADRGVVCQYTTIAFANDLTGDRILFSRWIAKLRTTPRIFYFATKPFTRKCLFIDTHIVLLLQ